MKCNEFILRRNHGAALIAALLVLAVCSSLVAFILMTQRLIIHQAILATTNDQLTAMLQGVQNWAIDVVKNNEDIHKVKSLQQTLNGIKFSGMIYALNGRFNVNTLTNTDKIPSFVRLIKAISPDTSTSQAQLIALQISQWVSNKANDNAKNFINKNNEHNVKFIFLHQPIVDVSELRLMPAMPYKVYRDLVLGEEPLVSALPTRANKINVNYASRYSFMTLDNITAFQAQNLVVCRRHAGYFKTVDDFIRMCSTGILLNKEALTINNQYYLIKGEAKQGEQRLKMQALLYKYIENDVKEVKIIWQEYNDV